MTLKLDAQSTTDKAFTAKPWQRHFLERLHEDCLLKQMHSHVLGYCWHVRKRRWCLSGHSGFAWDCCCCLMLQPARSSLELVPPTPIAYLPTFFFLHLGQWKVPLPRMSSSAYAWMRTKREDHTWGKLFLQLDVHGHHICRRVSCTQSGGSSILQGVHFTIRKPPPQTLSVISAHAALL